MIKLANKLKALRSRLRKWNKEVLFRVDKRVKQAEDLIMEEEIAFIQLRRTKGRVARLNNC